jgi:hypothetical protein
MLTVCSNSYIDIQKKMIDAKLLISQHIWIANSMKIAMTFTLQSSTFLIYERVIIDQYHLLIVSISPSWFDTQEYVMPMIDWLIIYGFTSLSRIFHLYGDVTIAGEGLQNLGLCSALRAFQQGGNFIVPHLLWHGASVFPVSSEGPPHSVASYDTRGGVAAEL